VEKGEATYYQNQATCRSYVVGVLDTFNFFDEVQKQPRICLPSNATQGQMMDVVVKYLQDHPAERQYPAAAIVFSSMYDSFRCKK
jgi:Ssp1 endopeptidase immunity protein Rap1a